MEGTFTSLFMRGLKQAAAATDLDLVVYGFPSIQCFDQLVSTLSFDQLAYDAAHLDGTISFFGDRPLIEKLGELHRGGHPCVLVLRTGKGIPHLLSDDGPSINAVVRRLHRNGHRRIAFLRGPVGHLTADCRFEAYREGLAQVGLPFDEQLVLTGDFREDLSSHVVQNALERDLRFTALLACGDLSALGALRGLKARGVSVPTDVELVGFGNIFAASLSDPPLTTFQLPMEELAHAAVIQMARLLKGERVPEEIMIPPVFVNRTSTRFTDVDPQLAEAPVLGETEGRLPPHIMHGSDALASGTTVTEVLVASQAIMEEAIRDDLDLGVVAASIVARTAAAVSSPRDANDLRSAVTASLALVLASTRLIHSKAAEHAQTFMAVTNRLRGLTFESLSEARIIDVLRETLGALGFHQARLYLQASVAEDQVQEEGMLFSWNLQSFSTRELRAARSAVLPAACELLDEYPMVFVLPLIVNDQVIGNLISDGRSRYNEELAELARHATGALHSVRLYRDLAHSNETLRQSEYFYSSLVQSLPQIIVRKDGDGRITYANSCFSTYVGRPLEAIIGKCDDDLFPLEFARRSKADDRWIMETGQSMEYEHVTETEGAKRFLQVKKTPLCDGQGRPIGVQVIFWDVTPFRETEARLKETQSELIEVSRRVGVAEVASGVLHNIGNAINSVNVSAGVVARHLNGLKLESVGKIQELLVRESEAWGGIFNTDERGRQVVAFIASLENHLRQKRDAVLGELQSLRDGVEHVNHIVASQQEFAQAAGLVEELEASEPLEYALRICETELLRNEIVVTRDYLPAPSIRIERHKAVQIIVKLVRNAVESLMRSSRTDKQLKVGVRVAVSGQVECYVFDNGVGIAAEHLDHIFTMGFTTKKGGHGFGLHNSALTAASLGGTLRVESAGLGQGALFVLGLPPVRP
jgi:PAS domain S-box-containing protein